MGILHPGITQSSLVLRSETGQRLSILQFDGNFVYLEDLVLGVSQSLASLPLVPAGGTGGQVLAKVSGTDYALEWIDQTGGTSGGGTGTAGTSGTSGTSGVNGTSGTSGVNGTSGTSGVNGTSGTSGVDGTSGTSGVDGTSGTSGIDGTSGTSGIDGTSGTSGIDGTSGTSGIDGTSGTSGIDGTSGTSGEKGAVGSTFNILGIFQNYTELTLAVGTMSSITPPNNFDSYIVIDTSNVWVYGPTESVANSDGWVDMGAIEGPQGLPGENGTSGTSGVNGADGANGTSGVNGADGANGTSGTSGVNGADGTSGTSGVNGADGIGIPTGGATGQVLVKSSEVDYEVEWADQTGGGGTGTNGTSGTSGVNGADGANGTNGVNGTSGVNGANGTNGTSGTSGVSGSLDIINNVFSLSSYDFDSLDPFLLLSGEYEIDVNNNSYEIVIPWDINFLGTTYSSIWLNTNSYVTFGASSSASQSIAPGLVVPPAIFVGAGDNSLQGYFFGFDDDPVNEVFRIRYEGSHDESGDFNFNPSIAWEMVFNFNTPNDIKLVIGANLRNPGGVYGVSDGTNWVERFTAIPTYDEKTNTMLNAVDILSITSGASYSQSTNEIKFVGPGVYKVSEGTKTTINIDPLNQYGVSINYDTAGASVISSNRYELRLTTGKDGSAVRLRPRGDVYLQPYSRNQNQFGAGYNVRLIGSNASKDTLGVGDYDGGSVFITPGTGIGTGVKGNVIIGTASSFVNIFGTMSINSVSGWSGTYSTGDGRVATVSSGIITGVA